jgi:hypothetical protein
VASKPGRSRRPKDLDYISFDQRHLGESAAGGALSPSEEVRVANHKYKVGQNVSFRPTRMSALAGPRDCQIVRQLPIEDGSYLYRIKCVGENVERVVKEGYLGVRYLEQ